MGLRGTLADLWWLDLSPGPARLWLALLLLLAGLLLVWLISPSPARAACPVPDPSYFDSCGPTFTLPAWGDAAGWDDPSKYSTIQLADVNGDGKDELLGRGDAGLEIWTFDTSVGQWRPQVDANAVPQILTDVRSPLPSEDFLGWKQPRYYSTIQTANVDGKPGVEVIARFPDGMHAYGYTPPAGGNSIDNGTWKTLITRPPAPFGDDGGFADPEQYLSIRSVLAGGGSWLTSNSTPPGILDGMLVEKWVGGTWAGDYVTDTLAGCSDPACYTSLKVLPDGHLAAAYPGSSLGQTVMSWQGPDRRLWTPMPSLGESLADGPLSNRRGSYDCPLSGDLCFPQIAALYETTRWANFTPGTALPQLVALGPQGLLVYNPDTRQVSGSVAWQGWGIYRALAYPASQWSGDPGKAASLMAADIDGRRGDEILVLQDGALQAWKFNPSPPFGLRQLQPTTPLALSDTSVWNQDASHYATFRHGDVDGDGREEVIARGPFGIRTWFWDRRGTGGWERYLPEGYPAFSGNRAAAFATLTEQAKLDHVIGSGASSVRDVWTGENPPAATDLTTLQQGVLSIADCTNLLPGEPPRYQTCNPPAGATFNAADWTAVINEVLAEIFAAGQVNAHFSQLDAMRQRLFIAEDAEFPSIGSDLGLQAAANTQATFDQESFWDTFLQIAGSLAGLVNPAAGAALSIAGDLVAMVPSATPSTTSKYTTTYAGVQDKFAASVSDADKAQAVLSQTVRQDYGLSTLVARLRQQGTWQPNLIGLASTANQAFAGWVYQSLLPAIYDRYEITDCDPDARGAEARCVGPSDSATYPGVVGSANGPNFTMLGPPPQIHFSPCSHPRARGRVCNYTTLPSDLANRLFGPVAPKCDYRPGKSGTAWTFDCNLGLSAYKTVGPLGGANGWNFTTYTGDSFCSCDPPRPATTRHAVGARQSVQVTGVLRVPRGFAFRRARAVATRVLHEPRGRKELAGPPRTVTTPPSGEARRTRIAGRLRARVALRRLGPTRLGFGLRTRRSGLRVPRACAALPRSIERRPPIVRLETRLRVSDGRRSDTHVIRRDFACVRDRLGNISHLRAVTRRVRHRLRPGLRGVLRLPREVRPGGTAVARLELRNARRPARGSTLWHLTVAATGFEPRRRAGASVRRTVRRLRAGRSTSVLLRLRVPRSVRGRFCVRTTTTADLARASSSRRCARVRRAAAPPVTG